MSPENTNKDGKISIDDFTRIDLRVAKVLEASEIEGADRDYIYLRYHRASSAVEGRFIVCHRDESACWLEDLVPVEGSIEHSEIYFS